MGYDKQKNRAMMLLGNAIKAGELVRASSCELCGRTGRQRSRPNEDISIIVGHHYNGHDDGNALNIWWICKRCNTRLRGRHDGSLTKDEARKIVLEYRSIHLTNKEPQ